MLDNIRTQIKATVQTLAKEVRAFDTLLLADYLKESRREIRELYKSSNSWTTVLRRAGLAELPEQAGEEDLLKRVHAFLHVDDRQRADAYTRLLSDDAPTYESLSATDQTYARMLFFNLWDKAGGFSSYTEGLESLRGQRAFRSELRQVLDHAMGQADHFPSHWRVRTPTSP